MSKQTPAINPTTNELGGDYQLGCAFLCQKDYKKAIHHFSEEIIRNPQNFDAFDGRARAHTELGNIPQAIEDYSQIIEQKQATNRETLNVYLKRAYLYSKKLEEYEKAIADLNEFINNTPKERIVEKLLGLHERGSIYKKLKKYELACDDFSAVLELNPNHIDVRIDRATFFIMLGQLEKAIEDYSIIIASDPHPTPGVDLYIANSYLRRGMIYSDRNETEKAFHDYSECIKIDNKEMYAFFNRGCISMLNRKNMKEAIEDFTRVLALDPLSHKAMYFRGACYAEEHDFPKALKDLENALRICPSSVKYQEVYERCTLMATVSTLLNITNGNNM